MGRNQTTKTRERYSQEPPDLSRNMWTHCSKHDHDKALGAVPTRIRTKGGFLAGEPVCDRLCAITGKVEPTYHGFLQTTGNDGLRYLRTKHEVTVKEFQATLPSKEPKPQD